MKIGNYSIQPISIHLPDEQKWIDRCAASKEYFESEGINDILWVTGIHAEAFGLEASRPYQRDVPDTDWKLPPKTVGNFLTAYMVMCIALSHPEWEYIMYLEDDVRFVDGWRKQLEEAMLDVPPSFDWLFVTHCCTNGRKTQHIAGNVYEVLYPQAGACSIISRKALETIILNSRNACLPFDVNLFDNVFSKLQVYTILPRLAEQLNTYLPK